MGAKLRHFVCATLSRCVVGKSDCRVRTFLRGHFTQSRDTPIGGRPHGAHEGADFRLRNNGLSIGRDYSAHGQVPSPFEAGNEGMLDMLVNYAVGLARGGG